VVSARCGRLVEGLAMDLHWSIGRARMLLDDGALAAEVHDGLHRAVAAMTDLLALIDTGAPP
jgi:hypothetical protein